MEPGVSTDSSIYQPLTSSGAPARWLMYSVWTQQDHQEQAVAPAEVQAALLRLVLERQMDLAVGTQLSVTYCDRKDRADAVSRR